MALLDTYLDVYFLDAAEREAKVSYLLDEQTNTDGSNMDDVFTNVQAILTALAVLTWDHIQKWDIRVQEIGTGLGANVAANNQVHARSYGLDADDNEFSFDVVAWDDAVYDQDSFNLLSAAYNTAAEDVITLIRNPESGQLGASVTRSVSKTHKSRGKKVV